MLRLLLVAGLFTVAVGCYLVACWLLCPGELRITKGATAMSDFVIDRRLCDDDGMVDGDYLGAFNERRVAALRVPVTEPFACTGSEHAFGGLIRCTSPAHQPSRLEYVD